MMDRLKTVYPPKTSFCGGYNDDTGPCDMSYRPPIQLQMNPVRFCPGSFRPELFLLILGVGPFGLVRRVDR